MNEKLLLTELKYQNEKKNFLNLFLLMIAMFVGGYFFIGFYGSIFGVGVLYSVKKRDFWLLTVLYVFFISLFLVLDKGVEMGTNEAFTMKEVEDVHKLFTAILFLITSFFLYVDVNRNNTALYKRLKEENYD